MAQRFDRGGVLKLVGPLCCCVVCCCEPGQGHNDPVWIAYEAQQRAEEEAEDGRRGSALPEPDRR